jgi:hypothetical protein
MFLCLVAREPFPQKRDHWGGGLVLSVEVRYVSETWNHIQPTQVRRPSLFTGGVTAYTELVVVGRRLSELAVSDQVVADPEAGIHALDKRLHTPVSKRRFLRDPPR